MAAGDPALGHVITLLVGHGVIFTLGWLDKLDAGRPLRGGASIQFRPVFVQFSSSSEVFEIYGEIFDSGRGTLVRPAFVHPKHPARVQRQNPYPMAIQNDQPLAASL